MLASLFRTESSRRERFLFARLSVLTLAATLFAASPVHAQPAIDSPLPLNSGDAFGEEVTLPARSIIYFRGRGHWDTAFESLVDAFGSLQDNNGIKNVKVSGNPMTIYTDTSDNGFEFLAALPIAEEPADPPKGDIAIGKTPSGRALKFTHRGSYEALDTTYEAITNYLDDKQMEAQDKFIEEYVSGPLKAGDNDMTVEIYVPVK
jgi:effector-binding domain-containing protein